MSHLKFWLLVTHLILVGLTPGWTQEITLLPSGTLLQPVTLDPHAPQISGSILSYSVRGESGQKLYSPLNIGFQRMLLRWQDAAGRDLEFGIEFGIHSQHSVVDAGEAYLGGLQNIDYRIGGVIHHRRGERCYKLLLFHQSSHLGDDYIIRNEITRPTPNTLNYEQLSLTRDTQRGHLRTYVGFGYNISPHTVRERIMLQGGYFLNKPIGHLMNITWVHGTHVKIFEENEYRPNVKTALGIEVQFDPDNPVKFLVEYYNGHLPYSTLEYQLVQLLGVGVYFNL